MQSAAPLHKSALSLRKLALLVHRYVGLLMAAFLIVAGVTGSVIAFYPQLDAALNPHFLRVEPAPGARMLDPFTLRDQLRAQLPEAKRGEVAGVILHREPHEPVNYWVDGKEVFVDPYTGKILESRTFGSFFEGRKSIFTFIYRLHFSLALDDVGTFVFGVIALLWTVDCFVGAYLTFPAPAQRAIGSRRSWLRRWAPAWALKTTKLFSLVFTWHRASGLWVWLMLLVFAWSGVALNLSEQVYEPVMHSLFGKGEHAWDSLPKLPKPRTEPQLDLRAAAVVGRRLMAAEARQRGFEVLGEHYLDYDAERGVYSYSVESTLDLSQRLAGTNVFFDGDTGVGRGFEAATGQNLGDTISSWLIALHFGSLRVGGLAYRSFVCAMGLLVTLLSVTGVWIWLKKRRQRQGHA